MITRELGENYVSNQATLDEFLESVKIGLVEIWHPTYMPQPSLAIFTKEEAELVTSGKNYVGKCFDQSGRYMLHNSAAGNNGAILVHGTINFNGIPISHSWVELGDKVLETTSQTFHPKDEYYMVTGAVAERKYSHTEAMRKMLDIGHFGPWHATGGLLNSPSLTQAVKRMTKRGDTESIDDVESIIDEFMLWNSI